MFIVHSDPQVKSMEKLNEEEETNQGNLLEFLYQKKLMITTSKETDGSVRLTIALPKRLLNETISLTTLPKGNTSVMAPLLYSRPVQKL